MPSAVQLKRFFRKQYKIPQNKMCAEGAETGWCSVRLRPNPTKKHTDPMVYSHLFPPELGQMCMSIVYANSESLSQQSWGGNITAASIAMSAREWETLFEKLGYKDDA